MSGFATYTKKRKAHVGPYEQAARRQHFHVVRMDGVLLGGSPDKAVAERLARVIRTGQRADYAFVTGGGR